MDYSQTSQKQWLIIALAAIIGYGYVVSLNWHPYPISYLVKASPMWLLVGLVLLSNNLLTMKQKIIYSVALLASSCGDILLDFDRVTYLKPALATFLVTQVCYISLFYQKMAVTKAKSVLAVLMVITALVLIWRFYLNAGAMFIPVLVYTCVLTAMGCCALMVKNNIWINIGGFLFLTADGLIGVNQFLIPFAYSTPIIVSIYLTSQLMIARGMLRER